jgi:hypothetical protein
MNSLQKCNIFYHCVHSINFEKRHTHFAGPVPQVKIIGQYQMSGRILLLPISGNGDINLTLGKYLQFQPGHRLYWLRVFVVFLSRSREIKVTQPHNTLMDGQGGQEVYPLLILNLGTRWGEWSASRPGRALPPGKGPTVPTGKEAGWAQSWSGHRGYRKILFLPSQEIETRPSGRPVRSHKLWLSYSGFPSRQIPV